jgi:cobalt/nickel transport system permease protein
VLLALVACIAVVALTPAGHAGRLAVEGALVLAVLLTLRAPPVWLLKRAALLLPFVGLALAPAALAAATGRPSASNPAGLPLARVAICFGALAAAARAAEPAALLAALARLRVPALLISVAALMLRYLGLLEGEAARMLRARDLRGRPPRVGERARVTGAMVGTLFVRSMERADRVSQAMQARGFTGVLPAPPPADIPRASRIFLGFFLLTQLLLVWLL